MIDEVSMILDDQSRPDLYARGQATEFDDDTLFSEHKIPRIRFVSVVILDNHISIKFKVTSACDWLDRLLLTACDQKVRT